MQKLAEQIAGTTDADKAVSEAAVKDQQTRKQINEIENALNGKEPASGGRNGADKADAATEKLATDAVAKAVNGDAVSATNSAAKDRGVVQKRNPGEIPANLSEETGAALKRFDSLLNGSGKLDRSNFANRLKSKPSMQSGGTTARADKEPVAPVARVNRGEEPGVRKINKASISGTDPKPEYVAESVEPAPSASKPLEPKPIVAKQDDVKPVETKATEVKPEEPKAVVEPVVEKKPSEPTPAPVVAAQEAPVVPSTPPAPQPVTAPEVQPKFEEEAAPEFISAGSGDTQIDFFAIRRSLRQLQFNYSINKPHDDSIRDEFEMILGSFSKMSVMYQSMTEDHEKRADERDKLVKARNDVRELTAELQKSHQQEKSAEARRKKDLEAFSQLTARQNASRSELREAQEQIEGLKREMKEQAQEFESKHAESMKLVEEASLAEAEKSVLRDSLTEACDKIAELLSGELRNESTIQALEDELEHYRVNAAHSEAG